MVCPIITPWYALLLLHSMAHYSLFYSMRRIWPYYLHYDSSIIPLSVVLLRIYYTPVYLSMMNPSIALFLFYSRLVVPSYKLRCAGHPFSASLDGFEIYCKGVLAYAESCAILGTFPPISPTTAILASTSSINMSSN